MKFISMFLSKMSELKDIKLYFDGSSGDHTIIDDIKYGFGMVTDKDGKTLLPQYAELLQDMEIIEVKCGPKATCRKFNIDTTSVITTYSPQILQQNNGAELLACVAALRIAINMGCKDIILYGDSDLIIKYWSVTGISKKSKANIDDTKKAYIEECIALRKKFESLGGKVIKIAGKENDADLGYHK